MSNNNQPNKSLTYIDRIRGSLYGLAIGDALGVPLEFSRITPKLSYTGLINSEHQLTIQWQFATSKVKPASVSDDTQMTLALLKALVSKNLKYDKDTVIMNYLQFANESSFLGRNTRKLFKGIKTLKGYNTRFKKFYEEIKECQSNGSLMRCSPLALLSDDISDHELSNPNIINESCNHAYLLVLKSIYKGLKKYEIKQLLVKDLEEYKYPKEVNNAVIDSFKSELTRNITGKTKGWVCNTLYIALYAFWNFETIENAMKCVIPIKGSDADTNGAVTGALFGAYLGFSNMISEKFTSENIKILITYTSEIKDLESLLEKLTDLL